MRRSLLLSAVAALLVAACTLCSCGNCSRTYLFTFTPTETARLPFAVTINGVRMGAPVDPGFITEELDGGRQEVYKSDCWAGNLGDMLLNHLRTHALWRTAQTADSAHRYALDVEIIEMRAVKSTGKVYMALTAAAEQGTLRGRRAVLTTFLRDSAEVTGNCERSIPAAYNKALDNLAKRLIDTVAAVDRR